MASDFETKIVSVERVKQYTSTHTEVVIMFNCILPSHIHGLNWWKWLKLL